jgi:hypothetical protein
MEGEGMKGKIIKAKPRKITINGQFYEFLLDMNAMCELDDIYANGDALTDMANGKFRAIRAVFYAGVKASLPEGATVEDFGSMFDFTDMQTANGLISSMFSAAAENLPEKKDGSAGE